MSEQPTSTAAELQQVAQMLGAVVEVIDRGEVASPRWLLDRIKAAAVTASVLAGEPGQATVPTPDR
jgi:hypothetical protein